MPTNKSTGSIGKQSRPTENRCDATGRWKWFFSGCLLLVTVNLLRSWSTFSSIGLHMEDGLLFSRYYGNALPITDIDGYFFGQPYKMVVTSFFAWIFAHFDVRSQPYMYLWTGFIWGTSAACCFFASGLIRSRPVLLIGPLLVGLVGLNHIYYYNTLIFVMYTCLAVLLALFFHPAPKTIFSTLLFFIAFLFLPWAGPYSVAVIPAALLLLILFWKDIEKKKRWLLLLSCSSAFVYYLNVRRGTSNIMGLQNISIVKTYFSTLLERIIFFDQFSNVSPWFWLLFLGVVGGSFVHFRKDVVFLKNSLVMLAVLFGSFAVFYLSSKYPAYIHPKPCHSFLSSFFWCIYLLYLTDHFFQVYGEKKLTAVVFSILVCAFIFVDNKKFSYRHKVKHPLPDTGAYVAAIHTMEQEELEKNNQYVVMIQYGFPYVLLRPQVQVGSRSQDALQIFRRNLPADLKPNFVAEHKIRLHAMKQ
ncbi:MAG: hypothetical protein D3924_09030 [Candidatus Electrothrix sp. AR4]|nr:hypothetical protein [Candidatus Electrothrix sp. AR4]